MPLAIISSLVGQFQRFMTRWKWLHLNTKRWTLKYAARIYVFIMDYYSPILMRHVAKWKLNVRVAFLLFFFLSVNFSPFFFSILNKCAILVKLLLKLSTFANDYNSFSVHFYKIGMSYRTNGNYIFRMLLDAMKHTTKLNYSYRANMCYVWNVQCGSFAQSRITNIIING